MNIRIYHQPFTHLYERMDDADIRIGYTACGIRYAWGLVNKTEEQKDLCPKCFPNDSTPQADVPDPKNTET